MTAVTSTLVAGSSDTDDIINFINNTFLPAFHSLDTDNINKTALALAVSDISNALATTGGAMTGNITIVDGGTFDGQDVSELGAQVTSWQTTVLEKSDIIILTGTCNMSTGTTDLYSVFTTAYPSYSSTTHNISYQCGVGKITPLQNTNSNYTLGDINCYMSGSTIVMNGTDRNGLAIDTADLTANYIIIAIPASS